MDFNTKRNRDAHAYHGRLDGMHGGFQGASDLEDRNKEEAKRKKRAAKADKKSKSIIDRYKEPISLQQRSERRILGGLGAVAAYGLLSIGAFFYTGHGIPYITPGKMKTYEQMQGGKMPEFMKYKEGLITSLEAEEKRIEEEKRREKQTGKQEGFFEGWFKSDSPISKLPADISGESSPATVAKAPIMNPILIQGTPQQQIANFKKDMGKLEGDIDVVGYKNWENWHERSLYSCYAAGALLMAYVGFMSIRQNKIEKKGL